MTQPSDKASIEAGLEQERHALAASLSELHHRMSLNELTRHAKDIATEGGLKSASLMAKEAKDHPVGAGLIGAGIAWMIFGPTGKLARLFGGRSFPHTEIRWEDKGGKAGTPPADNPLSRELDELRRFAFERLHQVEVDAKGGLDEAVGAARHFAAERAGAFTEFSDELLKKFADDLTGTLDTGLEHLTDQVRAAALKAGGQAQMVRVEAESLTRRHPVVMGMVGLGVGVALAALIPRVHARHAQTAELRERNEGRGMHNETMYRQKPHHSDRSQSHAAQ
ncbi:MAG: hypothetical protein H7245_02865 [Candidatus Saccharibacteria bacterium]|nr:hypothetical protein [Pseudorhodobacter sp.]